MDSPTVMSRVLRCVDCPPGRGLWQHDIFLLSQQEPSMALREVLHGFGMSDPHISLAFDCLVRGGFPLHADWFVFFKGDLQNHSFIQQGCSTVLPQMLAEQLAYFHHYFFF